MRIPQKFIKYILAFMAICIINVLPAQPLTIAGSVVSETDNSPLQGVSISIKGKTVAAQTNAAGGFTIKASKGDVLVFSYTGYINAEIALKDNENLVIKMKQDVSNLGDVVVVGYGTIKRSKLTASVSKLDKKFLETGVRSNPAQALAGTIPGLRVSTGTGRPGSLPSITLRGGPILMAQVVHWLLWMAKSGALYPILTPKKLKV